MLVKFLQPWRNYNAGELAGFDEETARMLVSYGTAEFVEPAPEERSVEEVAQDRMVKRSRRK